MPEHALKTFLVSALAAAPDVQRLVVGFSGGLDSSVLLQALVRVAPAFGRQVAAVHVHHGLSPDADAWGRHATTVCAALGVPLQLVHVDVAREGGSLEAAARTARRAAYADHLGNDDALLLAQHRGDQAETVLFRLFRGTGVAGLGAMRATAMLQRGHASAVPLWRPFLDLPRKALRQYADANGLHWIEDESNADVRHARNFLRHDIVPLLQARWPAVESTLATTAARMQEADGLLHELAAEMATACIDLQQRLHVPSVLALSPSRQRLLLRYWLQMQGFLLPDESVLHHLVRDVMQARTDAAPCIAWQGTEIRRYRGHLYAMAPLQPVPPGWECEWDGAQPLRLPDGALLLATGLPENSRCAVRYRRGGERFHVAGHAQSRELKTLLQEMAVPPWQRARLPLVFAGELLVGLPLPGVRSAALPETEFTLE